MAHNNAVIARNLEQWKFYKRVCILNLTNLGEMCHTMRDFMELHFPMGDGAFQNEWHQYCQVENTTIESPKALATLMEMLRAGSMLCNGSPPCYSVWLALPCRA